MQVREAAEDVGMTSRSFTTFHGKKKIFSELSIANIENRPLG
jgi:hypothetical protein